MMETVKISIKPAILLGIFLEKLKQLDEFFFESPPKVVIYPDHSGKIKIVGGKIEFESIPDAIIQIELYLYQHQRV